MVQLRQYYSSDLQQLPAMRAFVRAVCRTVWSAPSDEAAIDALELAVDEAAANIIFHAYERDPSRSIEMVLEADAHQVTVTLYHCGQDFEPSTVGAPVFDGSQETGFGIYLMRQSVDEVRYLHDDQGRSGICLVQKRA